MKCFYELSISCVNSNFTLLCPKGSGWSYWAHRALLEQVLAKKPPKLDLVQWVELVNYWFDEKTVVLLLYSFISF